MTKEKVQAHLSMLKLHQEFLRDTQSLYNLRNAYHNDGKPLPEATKVMTFRDYPREWLAYPHAEREDFYRTNGFYVTNMEKVNDLSLTKLVIGCGHEPLVSILGQPFDIDPLAIAALELFNQVVAYK